MDPLRLLSAAALALASSLLGCAGLRPADPAVAVAVFQDVAADGMVHLDFTEGSTEFLLEVPVAGRYRCELTVQTAQPGAVAWVEDYIDNDDGRTYDITSSIALDAAGATFTKDGCPLDARPRRMRLHVKGGPITVKDLRFVLLREHLPTPATLVQATAGEEWQLVWRDEFDGEGLPDPRNWTHDLGDWGWGNNEPQYYTEARTENARQEHGHLIIEARPDDLGHAWTSARLTTRAKVSFLYGRLEIRAKVPATDGTWAAGWLLGDAYRDELSWPYCGEIDVLEGVGREIDDTSGDGVNHASCHTRAYYFKQGNHISNTIPVTDMAGTFHVYAMDWDEREVRMYLDGEHYYTYDKHDSPEAWPFDQPQNLILNLAMGGGMGGAIAAGAGPQQFVIDYVRVYGRK